MGRIIWLIYTFPIRALLWHAKYFDKSWFQSQQAARRLANDGVVFYLSTLLYIALISLSVMALMSKGKSETSTPAAAQVAQPQSVPAPTLAVSSGPNVENQEAGETVDRPTEETAPTEDRAVTASNGNTSSDERPITSESEAIETALNTGMSTPFREQNNSGRVDVKPAASVGTLLCRTYRVRDFQGVSGDSTVCKGSNGRWNKAAADDQD